MSGIYCPYCSNRNPNNFGRWLGTGDGLRGEIVTCSKCGREFLLHRPLRSFLVGLFLIIINFLVAIYNPFEIKGMEQRVYLLTAIFPVIALIDFLKFKKITLYGKKYEKSK